MPKMMNSYELKKLFLKQKAKLPLQQIRLYIKARRDFLKLKSNDSSEDSHKDFLYSYLETLEPDVFFDTYYSDYFGIAKPFSCLCSHFQEINKNDNKELQNVKGNLVKSDLGLYYINKPTQARLELDKRYDGVSINFKKTYDKQKSPAKGEKRNKAQKVIFAPDFKIYYTTTQNGNYRQGRAFFAKYNKPLVDKNSKKDYYKKIVESEISISEKDDDSIKKKIINDFFDSLKFERLRNEAKKEIILALKEARLRNISVFTFTFAYSETIENFCGKNFDSKFCFNTLFQTKLGSLILNEATQEDFENAISELNKTKRIDSFKLIKQLGIILDIAKKKAVLYDSKSPVFAYLETRKKDLQIKAKMREAFTKKSLTHNEGRDLIKWLAELLIKKTNADMAAEQKRLETTLSQSLYRNESITALFSKLYEDNVSGKLSDEMFMELSHKYEFERVELKDRIQDCRERLAKIGEMNKNKDDFIKVVRKFMEMEILTAPMLRELIDHIDVYEKEGGKKNYTQQIVIYYRFVGFIEIPKQAEDENYKADTRVGVEVEYIPAKSA